ncbi:MAG: anti-sigma factor [Acetobacteraceae bacterium]
MSDRPITEEDLHAYVDHALDIMRHAEVARYLDRHPDVARRVQGYAMQREALRATLAPFAEEPVPPELSLARLTEARRRFSYPGAWRAAAAILLLLAGGAGGWALRGSTQTPPAGIAALAQEAADNYEVYGPDRTRPVEIKAADTVALTDWVSQRLQRPVVAVDLSAAGYRFMGGRLVATPHGPAGLFMYDDDHGTRLVMLVRPMATERTMPMSEQSRGPVAGFAWATNGLGYSLVGAAPAAVLHPLADEIRRQAEKSV